MPLDSYEIVTMDISVDAEGNLPVSPYVISAPAGKVILSAGIRINDGYGIWSDDFIFFDYPAFDGLTWSFCWLTQGNYSEFAAPGMIRSASSLTVSRGIGDPVELTPDEISSAVTMQAADTPITLWAVCA